MALTLVVSSTTVTAGQDFTVSATGAAPGELITFTYDDQPPQTATADLYGNTPTVTFTATTTGPVVAFGPISGSSNVVVVTVTQAFTAQPACYTLNFPPLPWSFVHTTLSVTGATPGAVVIFHLDGASGPVVCTATADPMGNASCPVNLNVLQVLYTTYTAATPIPGGYLTSTASLLPCLP